MNIYIGSDHRGFKLKEELKELFKDKGINLKDLGNSIYDESDDYPDFAKKVAEKVSSEKNSLGIVVCGSGIGVDVVANKIPGARSAIGLNPEQVQHGVTRDNINILALASDYTDGKKAEELISALINNKFKGEERDLRRQEKIQEIEEKNEV